MCDIFASDILKLNISQIVTHLTFAVRCHILDYIGRKRLDATLH